MGLPNCQSQLEDMTEQNGVRGDDTVARKATTLVASEL